MRLGGPPRTSHVFECVTVLGLHWGRRVDFHRDKLATQLGGGALSAKHRAGGRVRDLCCPGPNGCKLEGPVL